MLPLFCVRINPPGRAVSRFGHPVREPGAIYGRCNGLEPEFDLTGTRRVRPVEPLSPGLITGTVMPVSRRFGHQSRRRDAYRRCHTHRQGVGCAGVGIECRDTDDLTRSRSAGFRFGRFFRQTGEGNSAYLWQFLELKQKSCRILRTISTWSSLLITTAEEGAMATIALVDDDRNILTSVSMALEAEGYRTDTYTDGASALSGLQDRPPDIAIVDIKMPRMDGMELLRRLRRNSDLPVVFLTSKDEEIDELFGLKMGADDFIRKPFSRRLLVERVKAVLRRARPRDLPAADTNGATALERGRLKMDSERRSCTWDTRPVTLTVTEFLILEALAQRPGVVKSRDSLMDAAYDDQVYVDDRTIDSHIKRLRKKFKMIDNDFDVIETLYGVGYRFRETHGG